MPNISRFSIVHPYSRVAPTAMLACGYDPLSHEWTRKESATHRSYPESCRRTGHGRYEQGMKGRGGEMGNGGKPRDVQNQSRLREIKVYPCPKDRGISNPDG